MSKKVTVVKAWAVSRWTPVQLTEALTELNVSHSVVGWSKDSHALRGHDTDGLSVAQPAWPIVTHSVADVPRIRIDKERQILFVCDSVPALANLNLTPLPEGRDIKSVLKKALRIMDEDWEYKSTEPDIQDFVAMASKPSLLNQILTAIYKINPYAERKIIQNKVVMFLGGRVSVSSMRDTLRSNFKYDTIRTLLNTPEAVMLSKAVERAKDGEDIEDLSNEFSIEAFDISYILSSVVKQGGKV